MGKLSRKEKDFYISMYQRVWGISDIFQDNYGLDKNSFHGFYRQEYETLIVAFLEHFAPNVNLTDLHDNLIEIINLCIEDGEEKELYEYCDLMLEFKLYVENMKEMSEKL